jgi:hypothetical protein
MAFCFLYSRPVVEARGRGGEVCHRLRPLLRGVGVVLVAVVLSLLRVQAPWWWPRHPVRGVWGGGLVQEEHFFGGYRRHAPSSRRTLWLYGSRSTAALALSAASQLPTLQVVHPRWCCHRMSARPVADLEKVDQGLDRVLSAVQGFFLQMCKVVLYFYFLVRTPL